MKTIVEYENANKGCKLSDYIAYMATYQEQASESKKRNKDSVECLYKNIIGKYFIIKFNESAVAYVYIDKDVRVISHRYDMYRLYLGSKGYRIELDTKAHVNPLWFNFIEMTRGEVLCEEITKDEYDGVVKYFNNTKEFIKTSLNLK